MLPIASTARTVRRVTVSEQRLDLSDPGAGSGVRITAVEAIPFSLPYRRLPMFASGRVSRADNVLVRVHTDAGLVGQAEAQPRPYTYGETQASIVRAVRGPLAERLAGVDPVRPGPAAERCAQLAGNTVARGAVDLAVWDLAGPGPRPLLPRPAGRRRARRRRRAHALLRRSGGDGRGGGGGPRGPRGA